MMPKGSRRILAGALIPASEDTRGHGTAGMAKFWKQELQDFLPAAPRKTMSNERM